MLNTFSFFKVQVCLSSSSVYMCRHTRELFGIQYTFQVWQVWQVYPGVLYCHVLEKLCKQAQKAQTHQLFI